MRTHPASSNWSGSTYPCRVLLAVAALSVVGGCGGGYEDDNRSIVDELPTLQHATRVSVQHRGYCGSHACLFGNDRSDAVVVYEVDTSEVTQRDLADEFVDALPSWSATVEEICSNADPSFCDSALAIRLVRGDALITVGFDNWEVGLVEFGVDARGAR